MAFNFETLQKTSPIWFRNAGAEGDVVLGIMGRLVRNLRGHAFPGWSTAEGRQAVASKLLPAILNSPGYKTAYHAEMNRLSYAHRRALLERRQISPCMAARRDGCHLIISRKQDTVIMLNEEEHLAIHAFSAEADFPALLSRMQHLPEALSGTCDFAYDPRHGYLTSLPGEAGEGIQLYCVLHLPALTLSNMMPQVNRSIDKLQLNISPFYPHLGEECGNIYVLYTAPIIRGALEEIHTHFTDIMQTLADRENQVRSRLLELHETGDIFLTNRINRCYGLLRYARALTQAEWVDALSMLRLGVSCGIIKPTESTEEELLAQLSCQLIRGGEYPLGEDIAPRSHPRAATAPEIDRCTNIRELLSSTTLLTDPRRI